jgi:Na+/alanine symporter
MDRIIKVGLAVLFLICLIDMPFGYYQLVRYASMIGFAILAYQSKKFGKESEMFVYIALVVLFQPIMKIALGRTIWNIVDVIVGMGLLVSIWIEIKHKKS